METNQYIEELFRRLSQTAMASAGQPSAAEGRSPDGALRVEMAHTNPEQTGNPQAERSFTQQLARQAGLFARYGAQGLTALPALAWNFPAGAINYVAGTNIPRASIDPALDALGLPSPENATERVVGDVVSSLVGGAGAIKLAERGMKSLSPLVRNVSTVLSEKPGLQLASAGLAGGAAGTTREVGGGPMAQLAAGLVAPLSLAALSWRPAAAMPRAQMVEQLEKLEPTGMSHWGPVYGGLKGDPENAVAHLFNTRTGSVPQTHPFYDGEFSLVAGKPITKGGTGLLHVDAHGREAVLENLPNLIKNGALYGRLDIGGKPKYGHTQQLFLGDGEHEAIIRPYRDAAIGANSEEIWMPTAYLLDQKNKFPPETDWAARVANFTPEPSSFPQGTGGTTILPPPRDPRQYTGDLGRALKAQQAKSNLRKALDNALFGGSVGAATTIHGD